MGFTKYSDGTIEKVHKNADEAFGEIVRDALICFKCGNPLPNLDESIIVCENCGHISSIDKVEKE